MATAKRIRIESDVTEETKASFLQLLELNSGKSKGELIAMLVENYEKSSVQTQVSSNPVSAIITTLDDKEKKFFFSHMKVKGYLDNKKYLEHLSNSKHTLKGLVSDAIVASGKTTEEFLEDALIAQSKMELSLKARRDSEVTAEKDEERDERLRLALVALNQEIQEKGTYTDKRGNEAKPQGGKVNITAIADRAKVNQPYAKQWKDKNTLLFVDQELETEVDETEYDLEVVL